MLVEKKTAPVILSLDTGIVHEDYQDTANCLEQIGAIRRTCNIYDEQSLNTTLQAIENNEIDLIETRHIRKWQQNWKNVRPLFEKVEAAAKEHGVPMIPTPSMFRWNSDKAGYLKELESNSIPITPTIFLEFGQPFSLTDVFDRYPDGIVIKPSVGARSHGLQFIKKVLKSDSAQDVVYEISTPMEADENGPPRIEKTVADEIALERHFDEYRKLFRDEVILVQELIYNKTEYSAVMLSGIAPYYIKRIEGQDTGIGHDAFGGINVLEPAPSAELVEFAHKVRKVIPLPLRDEPIIRVDVLISPGREPMLLEIESGGPRLFNTADLGNTVKEYSNMLATIAQTSGESLKSNGTRGAIVNANLAPKHDILQRLFGEYV